MMIKQAGLTTLGLLCLGLSSTLANTYNQTAADPSTSPNYSSSFTQTARWSDGTSAPAKSMNDASGDTQANDYISTYLMRTPASNWTSTTYYFNTLTLGVNGSNIGNIAFKGLVDNTMIMTGDVRLDGGWLNMNAATSGSNTPITQTIQARSLEIVSSGSIVLTVNYANNNAGETKKEGKLVVNAPLTGGGSLLISNIANTNTIQQNYFRVTFQGDNSAYSGNILINNSSTANNTTYYTTVVVDAGSSLGSGIITLGQGGALTLTDADALSLSSGLVIGNTTFWQINLTSGITYDLQSFSIGGDIWSTIGDTIGGIGSGATHEYSQILGGGIFEISAIPEPSTYVLIGIGLATLVFLRRKSRRQVN
ncbi:MAG: PEP-CTERM sorting domain-containing protein [Verrucomicrobiales bacterium]|jgi:hypothetical protein|nr:PEP-CTERM sorting domain-containing protein [Verrucomicrobiales bacterium]